MAQTQQEKKLQKETSFLDKETKQNEPISTKPSQSNPKTISSCTSSSNKASANNNINNNNNVSFKFNAQAPEFVPRSHSQGVPVTATTPNSNNNNNDNHQMGVSGYFYPWFNYMGGGPDWFLFGDYQDLASSATTFLISNASLGMPASCSTKNSNVPTDDHLQKIVKQVEYQFSDMSLLANESMSRRIGKDPDGYVPISVIASTKKIKSLVTNVHLLTHALHSSSKLVVSEDGKKVKRKIPFSDKEKEELQSRTVVVENLPEDHSHQNLEKIFNVVGSVRNIRICHPQDSNSSHSKSDFILSNKLHALVEFESSGVAENAVEKLNDERNWRKGLRVRLLLRCSPKSVLQGRKSEFDDILDDEEEQVSESTEDLPQPNNSESITEGNAEENSASKKGWTKGGRGKSKGRGQSGGRGQHSPSLQLAAGTHQFDASVKSPLKGPRMPDGTRGFTMGRGKPLCTQTPPSPLVE